MVVFKGNVDPPHDCYQPVKVLPPDQNTFSVYLIVHTILGASVCSVVLTTAIKLGESGGEGLRMQILQFLPPALSHSHFLNNQLFQGNFLLRRMPCWPVTFIFKVAAVLWVVLSTAAGSCLSSCRHLISWSCCRIWGGVEGFSFWCLCLDCRSHCCQCGQ